MSICIREKIEKTDILIVGGGVGGLQAAITSARNGVKVIVAEKAHARRSGDGAMGNDHFLCYIPEVHGDDIRFAMREIKDTMDGPWQDEDMLYTLLSHSEDLIHKWSSYGINMKPTGSYHFEGHTIPGRRHYHLKFDGRNQKECLCKSALNAGAKIYNHITIAELLTGKSGKIIGAIGVDSSKDDPEMVIFQAKAVILATGTITRAFPVSNPAYMFNSCNCPSCAGSVILGYRAGARMVNYDMLGTHAGPKYFERCGKATWIGMLSDSYGNPAGPFVSKPSREYGDPMSDIWPGVFTDKMKNGTAPVYMNCTQLSREDLEYMKYCFDTEGITSMTEALAQWDIDLSKSMIEFGTYATRLNYAGLDVNVKAETSVEGLYGAGVAIGNVRGHITQAAVFGDIAGESAAEYVKTVEEESVEMHPLIEKTKIQLSAFIEREYGADWKESNSVLQQIMKDYIGGENRTTTLLQAGLKYIRDLKKSVIQESKCNNAHELIRLLEVIDLIDTGELAALVAENRKETRGPKHKRPDYPFTNPLLNDHLQTAEKIGDKVKLEFRPVRRI